MVKPTALTDTFEPAFFSLSQYQIGACHSPKMVDQHSYILGYENDAVCMMIKPWHPEMET